MKNEEITFHNLLEKPAILNLEQTAWRIGIGPEYMPLLAKIGVLKPLGHPLPPNAVRLYSNSAVTRYIQDEALLERTRKALLKFWHEKNQSRLTPARNGRAATGARSSNRNAINQSTTHPQN